jgi:hypothetical protein
LDVKPREDVSHDHNYLYIHMFLREREREKIERFQLAYI